VKETSETYGAPKYIYIDFFNYCVHKIKGYIYFYLTPNNLKKIIFQDAVDAKKKLKLKTQVMNL